MTLEKYTKIVERRFNDYKMIIGEKAFFNALELIRLDVQDALRAETEESLTVLPDPQNIMWQSNASFMVDLTLKEFIENFSLKIFYKSGKVMLLKDALKE